MNVFEKIREKLEEYHEHCVNAYGIVGGNSQAFATKQCIEIVNQVEQEHNNGWIPCRERLPEVEVAVLVTHQNGNVQIAQLTKTGTFVIYDEECGWFRIPVTAWMPLPQSYKGRD